MSIREFHSQLVSGNSKNNLLNALRKLSLVADPQSLFAEEPAGEWPLWNDSSQSRSAVLRPALGAA
jgi:hypothetical protein